MTVATIPGVFYEFAFNADPLQNTLPPYWSDLSSRVLFGWTSTRGRQYELDVNETGEWTVELDNRDGALDPGNAASPYAPGVLPYRQCRIRFVLGNNLLSPDQASAGEWSPLAPGVLPWTAGVSSAAGYTVTAVTAGAGAYQGTQVFATTVPSGATAPKDFLDVAVPAVTAGQTYTVSAQVQATTAGQNPTVNAAIDWLNTAGTVISTTSGTGAGLTGASGTWTQVTASGQAPAGAVAATARLATATTPGANTTFWADGLQLEARGYATRWQMPYRPGVNLLPQTVATGLETMNPGADTATNWLYPTGAATVARATNLTAAPTGATTAAGWTIPASTTAGTALLYAGVAPAGAPAGPAADCAQVTPGQQYTASAYLLRTSTVDAIQVSVSVAWYGSSGGAALSTTAGTAVSVSSGSWTRATVTGTAPAGAVWGRPVLTVTAPTTTVSNTVYAAGWQMEQAASASAWADPGPALFPFSGYVERWPRAWDEQDTTFGTSRLVCVDAFAALAQFTLQDPLLNEVLALGPNFCYVLNDPAGSTAVSDAAGRRVGAPVENSPYGVGSLTFGNAVTSSGQSMVGGSGPVATFNNSPSTAGQRAETYISIHKTTATPGPPITGAWTRILAFRSSAAPPGSGNAYQIWNAQPPSPSSSSAIFQMLIDFSGKANLNFTDNGGVNGINWGSASSVCDGNWHLIAMGLDPSTGNNPGWFDGVNVATATGVGAANGWASDVLGAYVLFGTSAYSGGHVGDMAFAIEVPALLTNAQMTNLYNSFRTASSGESTGARYQRVLNWCGWTGPAAIDSGATQSMGPATDLSGAAGLDALNSIALTENGDQFAAGSGVLTFRARSAYYNVRTPAFVLGEGAPVGSVGEWPCEIGTIDFDPSHISNITQVQQHGGSIYQVVDATSRRRYFPRVYQRTVNTSAASEAQTAATYLTGQLKDPHQRADVIRLHPSAVPGLFAVCAQLEKGVRFRYIKRPPGGAPSTTLDVFLQKVDWTWTADGDVFVDLQASPADLQAYGVLAALHTTLNVQAASGQDKAAINALPDAATNQLVQSLPSGYSLRFEPGTARDETLTLAAGGIPATTPPWTTAQLTFTSNFAFTHAAGTTVCEPLPTGYADPTAWDASAVAGAAYTTVLSGGGSGTNTVTVGPLQDAAYNALGSTWNGGDQITLSPGTGNAETMTIKSVATTVPGYGSCVITFTANLAHSHAVGDYVCDVLPGGVTNPTALAPTLRLAY